MKNNRNISLYWLCQLLGWGSAAVYWSYYQISDTHPLWLGILSVVVPFLSGIGSTHLYRTLAHRYAWIHLKLRRLLPVIFAALVVLTGIYVCVVGLASMILLYSTIGFDAFLGMFAGGLRYISIWLLAFHLYHYARNSRQAEINQVKYEKLALAAQFDRLNAELNPHLLFNSLNSIKALILENPQAARDAIDLLSNMLRSSLRYTDGKLIPLEEELARVNSYLALEKIRFEERLSYSVEISEEAMKIVVPPLSVYNLVENAIKHGIGQSTQGGHVLISASLNEQLLTIRVVNDGKMEEEYAYGTGLNNVTERLTLVYGSSASFELSQLPTHQVAANLSLPISYAN